MNDVDELIAEAKRELHKALGTPLTPEEQTAADRRDATDALGSFVFEKFRYRVLFPFNVRFIWTDRGAAAEFRVKEKKFLLRRANQTCRLSAVEEQGERELAAFDESDPHLVSKVLVTIGNNS